MKIPKKNLTVIMLLCFVIFGLSGSTMAATTPDLGAAASFGVLADTFSITTATTINGDLGYTTLSVGLQTVIGSTYIGGGSATYSAAGTAQSNTLTALGSGVNALCNFSFAAGAIDLATDTTHGSTGVYEPGIYCTTTAAGAMSIGTAGITLSGAGTYIFRTSGPSNALTTVAGSEVRLTNGASACDVFWTPTSATTLAATTNFIGTVISPAITVGLNTVWTGRALAFGYTVTTNNNTITVPTGCAPASATLYVIKSVVGSTAIPADFIVYVKDSSNATVGSGLGTGTPGTSYIGLSADTYTISDVNSSYTQSFTGDCLGGSVTLLAGSVKTCTIINTYITPSPSGGGGSSLPIDSCPNGDYSTGYYDGGCGIAPIVSSGTDTIVGTGDVIITGSVIGSGIIVTPPVILVSTPTFPNTGLTPEGQRTLWNIIILAGIFVAVCVSVFVLKKRRI